MRFHKFFIENGLVFVEVLQKDSPLTPEKATLFLTLLQQESDEQAKLVSATTVLARMLQKLPTLVESMKVIGQASFRIMLFTVWKIQTRMFI